MEITSIKKSLIISSIVALIAVGSMYLSSLFLGAYDNTSYKAILGYILPIGTTLAMIFLMKRQADITFEKGHLLKVFSEGWYFFFMGIFLFVMGITSIKESQFYIPNIAAIITFVIYNFLTGIYEELLCRGLIQGMCLEAFEKRGKSPLGAILTASAIFGVIHFVNLFNRPDFFLGTVGQVVYAFFLGTLLGVIYYFTRNIGITAFLHGFFNTMTTLADVFTYSSKGATTGDMPIEVVISQTLFILPAFIIALVIYRINSRKHKIFS